MRTACPTKTHTTSRFERSLDPLSVHFCDQDVDQSTNAIHPGHHIDGNYHSETSARAVNDLNRRTNCLMSKFSLWTSDTKYRLFKSYCMSAYGAALWNYDHVSVEKYWRARRRCVRRIFSLPYTTHCTLLPEGCNDRPVQLQLHSSFFQFFESCCQSKNCLVKVL